MNKKDDEGFDISTQPGTNDGVLGGSLSSELDELFTVIGGQTPKKLDVSDYMIN